MFIVAFKPYIILSVFLRIYLHLCVWGRKKLVCCGTNKNVLLKSLLSSVCLLLSWLMWFWRGFPSILFSHQVVCGIHSVIITVWEAFCNDHCFFFLQAFFHECFLHYNTVWWNWTYKIAYRKVIVASCTEHMMTKQASWFIKDH